MIKYDNKIKIPFVSVVILNWNGKRYLENCLKSLIEQTYRFFEIIVVDNGGSTDGSIEMCKNIFSNVKLILIKKNIGYAGGCNVGVSYAKGELVAILCNDNVAEKTWLEELVNGVLSNHQIGCAMSKSYTKGVPKSIYEKRIGTINLVGRNVLGALSGSWEKKIHSTFYASGNSLIFRKDSIGTPFDPDYYTYAEDVYLSWFLRLKGFDIVHIPNSIVHHEGSITTKRKRITSIFYSERNRLMNLFIFYQFLTLLKISPFIFIDFFLIKSFKQKIAIIGSFSWMIMNFHQIMMKRKHIQRLRKIDDKDVLKHMSSNLSNSGIFSSIANKFGYLYCKIMKLYTMEFYSNGK